MTPPGSVMDARKYFEQVRTLVEQSERFFVSRRAQEKRRAFYSSLSISIAAAIATFAVGLGSVVPGIKTAATVAALVAGATTTVLAAYEAHWDHKRLWAYRTQIVFLLQQLLRDMDIYAGKLSADEAPDPNVTRSFHERHERIREFDIRSWFRLRGVDYAEPESDPETTARVAK